MITVLSSDTEGLPAGDPESELLSGSLFFRFF
jgi:hypothetical protein